MIVNPSEISDTFIHIVITVPEIKIDDVYRYHLADFIIVEASIHMVGYQF